MYFEVYFHVELILSCLIIVVACAEMIDDDVMKWNIFTLLDPLWGESMVTGGFPSQRPVTRSFGVFFDLPEQTV